MATHNFEAMAAKLDDASSGTDTCYGRTWSRRQRNYCKILNADYAQISEPRELKRSIYETTSRVTAKASSIPSSSPTSSPCFSRSSMALQSSYPHRRSR